MTNDVPARATSPRPRHVADGEDRLTVCPEDVPVFLVGAERSGTTLVRLMLDSHPEIAFECEFEYAVDLVDEDGRWPNLRAYHRWLADFPFVQTPHTVDTTLAYPALVRSFLAQKREADAKPHVGATVHRHFDRLLGIWPQARFIHLIRDGRDVARSCIAMGWAGNGWTGADRWIEAEHTWERLKRILPPDRWIEIRYEDLVSDAESVLRRISGFFGVAYDPAMFAYADSSTYGRPDSSLAQQWRTRSSPEEIRLIEARIGGLLIQRGYELSAPEPTPVGALRRVFLRIHDRYARARFRLKRLGLSLWCQDLLATRVGFRLWRQEVRRRVYREHWKYLK